MSVLVLLCRENMQNMEVERLQYIHMGVKWELKNVRESRSANEIQGRNSMKERNRTNQYGAIFGRIRRNKEIKAATLAHRVGISTSTYSRIENGRRSATLERVDRICHELGFSLTQLAEELKNTKEVNSR